MIGVGVHADVHDLHFSNAGARLWAPCDGGVFRSSAPTQQVGFVACNDGLSIVEANYVASHPTCEGHVVLGLQDNGVIERDSTGVWRVDGGRRRRRRGLRPIGHHPLRLASTFRHLAGLRRRRSGRC